MALNICIVCEFFISLQIVPSINYTVFQFAVDTGQYLGQCTTSYDVYCVNKNVLIAACQLRIPYNVFFIYTY